MPIRQITQDELDELFGDGLILIGEFKPITIKEGGDNKLQNDNSLKNIEMVLKTNIENN